MYSASSNYIALQGVSLLRMSTLGATGLRGLSVTDMIHIN